MVTLKTILDCAVSMIRWLCHQNPNGGSGARSNNSSNIPKPIIANTMSTIETGFRPCPVPFLVNPAHSIKPAMTNIMQGPNQAGRLERAYCSPAVDSDGVYWSFTTLGWPSITARASIGTESSPANTSCNTPPSFCSKMLHRISTSPAANRDGSTVSPIRSRLVF